MPENVFINYNFMTSQVVQKLVNDNQILPDKSCWWTVQLLVPGCWITARWEWGEAAGCVWACSICYRGGSLRAVLGRAGLPVSEENRLLGAREPSGCSAPDADGRRGSVGSLPRGWGHQPSGQPRPSTAQAWKIRQRGRDQTFSSCQWPSLGVWGIEPVCFRWSLDLPLHSRERPSCVFSVPECLFVPASTWRRWHSKRQDM